MIFGNTQTHLPKTWNSSGTFLGGKSFLTIPAIWRDSQPAVWLLSFAQIDSFTTSLLGTVPYPLPFGSFASMIFPFPEMGYVTVP